MYTYCIGTHYVYSVIHYIIALYSAIYYIYYNNGMQNYYMQYTIATVCI